MPAQTRKVSKGASQRQSESVVAASDDREHSLRAAAALMPSNESDNSNDRAVGGNSGYAPEKYLAGLSERERAKRRKEIARGSKTSSDDPAAYKDARFATDFDAKTGQRRKTKTSEYTKKFYTLYPTAKSLEQKADATGVPLDILQQVYNRGLAAYRTGHRPGASQGQWASARVHSFLVKGCTYYFPDHKLAAEAVRRSSRARAHFAKVDCLCRKGCTSGSRSYGKK